MTHPNSTSQAGPKLTRILAAATVTALTFGAPAWACETIERSLQVCTFDTGWDVTTRDEDGVTFENGNGYFGRITVHLGGFAAGTLAEQMAGLIAIQTRQTFGGQYELVAEAPYDEGRFTYIALAEADGTSELHANTFVSLDAHTVQISTWRAGDTLTEADRLAHLSFGGLLSGGGDL
ncbi:MAG: hypothetical protein AAF092_10415 [Pseudomonadota bacterium]